MGLNGGFLFLEDFYVIDDFLHVISKYRINEISDILGLAITVIGFICTTIALIKSKKATANLKFELERVRTDLRRSDTVSETSSALALMDEIKRMHRQPEALSFLPERYSTLKKTLNAIRSHNPVLTAQDQETIQSAVTQFAALERQVETILAGGTKTLDVVRVNSVVSKKIDSIQELLIRVKGEIGN